MSNEFKAAQDEIFSGLLFLSYSVSIFSSVTCHIYSAYGLSLETYKPTDKITLLVSK
jgi:hypothetical protein